MTTVENELATFWKEIPHYDDVLKEEDNFFQLGSNSIHAIHLQHFLNKKFNLSISFKNIFENQTISALSTLIETKREHAPASSLDPNRGNGINYQTSNNTFTQEESTKTILTQTFIEPDVIRAPRKNKNHGSVFLPVTPGVLIGKPIPNSTAYILDDTLHLLPIGVKGEIYLGGLGVAREYINNEEKTKERFVDDPFSEGIDYIKQATWVDGWRMEI